MYEERYRREKALRSISLLALSYIKHQIYSLSLFPSLSVSDKNNVHFFTTFFIQLYSIALYESFRDSATTTTTTPLSQRYNNSRKQERTNERSNERTNKQTYIMLKLSMIIIVTMLI